MLELLLAEVSNESTEYGFWGWELLESGERTKGGVSAEAWGIRAHGASCEGELKIVLNMLLQVWDVQSGWVWISKSCRIEGMGVGDGSACGWSLKKRERLLRERASAMELFEPGTWEAEINMLKRAKMKCTQRINPITDGSLLVPELIMCTTASLSQRHESDLLCHCSPHIAAAITIGSSSLYVMWKSRFLEHQRYWNHALLLYAPHPHDASDVRKTSGLEWRKSCIIDKPFQCAINWHHHTMSERASRLSRIKLLAGRWCEAFIKSIRRRINVRPGRMTMLASCSWPTTDCRLFFLQPFKFFQVLPVDEAAYHVVTSAQAYLCPPRYRGKLSKMKGPLVY